MPRTGCILLKGNRFRKCRSNGEKERRYSAATLCRSASALAASAFAYVGDPDKTGTWKLPIKFSTEEKTKSHIQNALARFSQTKGIPDSDKPKVLAKIKAAAKAHGIHVSDEAKSADIPLELAKARVRMAQISQ